ncbi:hypothetical protein IJG27_03755 [Candidatus Saccharibacteria bacterium]|nr:hypothetical protein [Candidatus Saccharibacteria bacterium]MBQ3467937.1 hypothetical protein [Candidatus Saccharibacteria bacterium]
MKKRLKKIPKVKTWQLVLILIPMSFISATLLRFDHLKMIDLKNAVISADESGDEQRTKDALNELKKFVESHNILNIEEKNGNFVLYFGSGEIYLAKTYERTATAMKIRAQEEAGVYANPNGNIYAQAMAVCQPLAHQYGWSWDTPEHIACYQQELSKYPTTETIEDEIKVDLPSTSLYRYDFISPIFTFTPSGIFVVLTIILTIVIIVRFFLWLAFKIAVKFSSRK